jgi:hypothetical protein
MGDLTRYRSVDGFFWFTGLFLLVDDGDIAAI